MAAKGDLLGYEDCHCCGYPKGMRYTLDKNLDPFGFCEGKCRKQDRIGPDQARVKDWYALRPDMAAARAKLFAEEKPNTPPERPTERTEETPAPGQRETSPGPAKRRSLLAELLDHKD